MLVHGPTLLTQAMLLLLWPGIAQNWRRELTSLHPFFAIPLPDAILAD